MKDIMAALRRYFFSGLFVWLPIWVTLLVIKFLLRTLDSSMLLLPQRYQLDALIGLHIPGLNILVTLTVIVVTGMIVANFVGKKIIVIWDALVGRIPLVRSVHAGVKQVLQTIFTPGGQSFRKVLLVEYPRPGLWSIAFQTGDATKEVVDALGGVAMVTLFIPTTPNPTSGFLMMAKRSEVIELQMSVEQALKFVISLGVVQPWTVSNGKIIT